MQYELIDRMVEQTIECDRKARRLTGLPLWFHDIEAWAGVSVHACVGTACANIVRELFEAEEGGETA